MSRRQVDLGKVAVDDETSIRKLEYIVSVVSWWNSKRLIAPYGYKFENARMRMLSQGGYWKILTIFDKATGAEILSEYINGTALQTVRARQLVRTLENMIFRWQGLRFRTDPGMAPLARIDRIVSRLREVNRQKSK